MPIHNLDELVRALDELHSEREVVALKFEKKGSLEMAYVARWSVIEYAVKRIVHVVQCESLRQQLDTWQEFLNEPNGKSPSPIHRFPLDPAKARLPSSEELKNQFAAASNLLDLLDPKKKYRKKRNAIAHSAEAFGKKLTYVDYKAKIEAAVIELRDSLAELKSTEEKYS